MKLLIAESKEFSQRALDLLKQHFDVTLADLDRASLLKAISDPEVLWVRLRTMIDAEIMDAAPKLKSIATNTTGLTHIDLEAANQRNIEVISLRGEADFLSDIRATAEHTIGLTLALLRKIPAAHQHVCEGGWNRYQFKGHEIYQQTVGIIGYGRLGRITARYFEALGAQVLAHDVRQDLVAEGDVKLVNQGQLLRESDVVSLHVNFVEENRNMVAEPEFEQMKPNAVFVNTARGELVDEIALVDALESGCIAGAALDVLDDEHCFEVARPIVHYAESNQHLLLTPHLGGNTFESHHKTEEFLAQKMLHMFAETQTR